MKPFIAGLFVLLLSLAGQVQAGELSVPDHLAPVPYFQFADAEGRQFDLSHYRGKVVILDVWATWCAPCRAEFPSLDRLQGKMKGRDVVVIPVSVDRLGLKVVDRFYRDLAVVNLGKYTASQDITRALRIRGIPTTLFVDRQGQEVGRVEGTAEWDDPGMIHAIDMLLR